MSDGPSRFLREARAAAVLGHPNIVPVYEAGNAGPSLYLTMELIYGPTLAQWITVAVNFQMVQHAATGAAGCDAGIRGSACS